MGGQEGLCGVSYALSYAVSEWLLMLLLFIDGLFSYLVTKFAVYCKLQTPCLFCSRLDHILGSKEKGFYKDLICISHKMEISSWTYCHIHQKLTDVCDMCESCLLSYATAKKSNTETYRSLAGKLAINLESDRCIYPNVPKIGAGVSVPNDLHNDHASFVEKKCSCCKNCFVGFSAERMLQNRSSPAAMFGPDGELLHPEPDNRAETPNPCKTRQLSWKSRASFKGDNYDFSDPLAHFGYTKLNIDSYCKPELLASGDDNRQADVQGNDDTKKAFASRSTQTIQNSVAETSPAPSSKEASEKLVHIPPIVCVDTVATPEKQIPMTEPSNCVSFALTQTLNNSVAEISARSPSSKEFSESLVHNPPIVSVVDTVVFPEKQIPMTEPSDSASFAPSSSSRNELKELDRNVQVDESSSHMNYVLDEASLEVVASKKVEITDVPLASSNINEEVPKTTDLGESIPKLRSTANDLPGVLDLNDTYKLVTGNKGHEASPRDPFRAQEELRLLLSQLSSARGLDFPFSEWTPSPRVHAISDEVKSLESPGSSGLHIVARRFSLERNESGLSSVDGSVFSEIEGESVIDRLKRLVEFEKKSLIVLYKELDEERSASAVAANQAMAMITRLQEEKAAMQMEALHYQRMMEDQAEYDHAALQKLNDLLAEKEKELEGLKFEISTYRNQFIDMYDTNEVLSSIDVVDEKETTLAIGDDHASLHIDTNANLEKPKEEPRKVLLLNFDDERLYISESLKKLERKLYSFSKYGTQSESLMSDSKETDLQEHAENDQNDEKAQGNCEGQNHCSNKVSKNSQMGKDSVYLQVGSGSSRQSINLPAQFHAMKHENHPSYLPNSNPEELHRYNEESNLLAFEAEIAQLNDRLKALESGQTFIEYSINSLKYGDEGLHFIHQIASHLQELQEFRIRRKQPTS